jgi:hypothetical protein
MQIEYVKISCKEGVHICRTNFEIEWNEDCIETTSQWKTYGKQLFFENLEVQDVAITIYFLEVKTNLICYIFLVE